MKKIKHIIILFASVIGIFSASEEFFLEFIVGFVFVTLLWFVIKEEIKLILIGFRGGDSFRLISGFLRAEYQYIFNNTGIAINKKDEKIFLFDSGSIKTYGFHEILHWRLVGVYTRYDEVFVNKVSHVVNGKFDMEFIISVRDVCIPEWRIKFKNNLKSEGRVRELEGIIRQCAWR